MAEHQMAVLHVNGRAGKGLENKVSVRDLPAFSVDEPERLGGTNTGPNPLEYFLGALSACTSIMVAYVAKEQNFSYEGLEYDASGTLDPRGFRGVEGVQTYFQSVELNMIVETAENEAALERLKEAVEKRCPLYNLLKDAGVEVNSNWTSRDPAVRKLNAERQGEMLWNRLLSELTPAGTELQTKTGLWFTASSINGNLYVDKATSHSPSSKLSMPRPISKSDFIFVHSYYDRWKNKEVGIRHEVSSKSQNTAYIFALIEEYM